MNNSNLLLLISIFKIFLTFRFTTWGNIFLFIGKKIKNKNYRKKIFCGKRIENQTNPKTKNTKNYKKQFFR